ncbi:hypothetical protein C3F09_08880, partial [candidate division GN15 bacterium]
ACGALGAAIWIRLVKCQKEAGAKITFNDPRAADTIDRFLKCTNYEFECSTIVGRKFASVDDHAEFVRCGGCAKVLEALAAAGLSAV